MAKPIKVRVVLSIEVDPEAWEALYGIGSIPEVRDDVRVYVQSAVDNSAASDEGAILSAKVVA